MYLAHVSDHNETQGEPRAAGEYSNGRSQQGDAMLLKLGFFAGCLLVSTSVCFADEARLDASSFENFQSSMQKMSYGQTDVDRKKFMDLALRGAFPSVDQMNPVQAMIVLGLGMQAGMAVDTSALLADIKPYEGMTQAEFIAALEAAPPITPPGVPDILATVTLENLRDVLQDEGYKAKLTTDKGGDFIASSTGGAAFFINLDGCSETSPHDCSVIVFESAAWKPAAPMTLAAMNTLSGDSLFGWGTTYAAADDGTYSLTYRASLEGGVTKAWIEDTTTRFGTALEKFAVAMDQ
jgi:Putative bacterial sensory transduction regulator